MRWQRDFFIPDIFHQHKKNTRLTFNFRVVRGCKENLSVQFFHAAGIEFLYYINTLLAV